jgi:hypothetical protein
MPHFVAVPATPNSPGLSSLPLRDPSGNGAVGVWAGHRNWSIKSCSPRDAYKPISNPRFQFYWYNTDANRFAYFNLMGLKKGDWIAAYDENDAPQTAALEITLLSAQGSISNIPAGQNTHDGRFWLNPAGAEQSEIKTTAQEWLSDTDIVIKYVTNVSFYKAIEGSLPSRVDIFPYLKGDNNADSSIRFSRKNTAASMMPGDRPNETLFHELCHRAENRPTPYKDIKDDASGITYRYSGTDFFSVTATNVYASILKRPLRKDHVGVTALDRKFSEPTRGAQAFAFQFKENFDIFKNNNRALFDRVKAANAPWNPFKFIN